MPDDNANYYRERACTERSLARAAGQQEVREIHEELARQYESLVQQAALRPILRIVDKPRKRGITAA